MSDKNICRLCLTPLTCIHFSLFENNANVMLESLTRIKITVNDLLPTEICTQCQVNLQSAYDVQQRFLSANDKLKQQFEVITTIDEEEDQCDQQTIQVSDDLAALDTIELEDQDDFQHLVHLSEGQCVICNCDVDDHVVISHLKEHYGESLHCEFCTDRKLFQNAQAYREHLLADHSNVTLTSHECKQCNVIFPFMSFLDTHLLSKHSMQDEESGGSHVSISEDSTTADDNDIDVVNTKPDQCRTEAEWRLYHLRLDHDYHCMPQRQVEKLRRKANRLSEKVRRDNHVYLRLHLQNQCPELVHPHRNRVSIQTILNSAIYWTQRLTREVNLKADTLESLREDNVRLIRRKQQLEAELYNN